MQQKRVELFKGGLFLDDLVGDYSTYTLMEIYVLPFLLQLSTFIFCFLTFCSLGSNEISDKGAHAVAAALEANHSLQELE